MSVVIIVVVVVIIIVVVVIVVVAMTMAMSGLRIHSNNWEAPAAASTGVSHTARAGGSIGRDGGWAGWRMARERFMSEQRAWIKFRVRW
jgi:uncharacterized membrane protein